LALESWLHYGSLLWRELTSDCGSFVILAPRRTAILRVCSCFDDAIRQMSLFEKHQPSRRTNWIQPANFSGAVEKNQPRAIAESIRNSAQASRTIVVT
jgi:hypothetical protein